MASQTQTHSESSQQLLFDKRVYYAKITRNIRWATIALVVASMPLDMLLTPFMVALIGAAIIYNTLWYWPGFMLQPKFGSFISMNIVDNGFVLLLVLMTGGLASPYYILFTFMVITATFWFGYRGLAALAAFHLFVLAGLFLFDDVATIDQFRNSVILVFTIATNGVLAERMTHGDRQERIAAVRANQEKEAEKQRLLSLINSISFAIIAVRDDGSILMYNGATLELFDTNTRLQDQPIDQCITLKDNNGESLRLMDLLEKGQGIQQFRDLGFTAGDGSRIDLDITASPITATSNQHAVPEGYIIMMRDVTKEKSLDEVHDEFISVTAHELKTPIAIAEASLSTALMPDLAPDKKQTRDLVQKGHDNVKLLGNLVRDLSMLTEEESSISKDDIATMPPAEIIEQLQRNYADEADQKGLELKTDVKDDMPAVTTSQSHVYEILQNFLDNAIKYTKEGTVTIGVKPDETTNASVFYVEDTGSGISATDKKQIFDKFYRSEDYHTRETSGTGLGLYVARTLAGRINGEVWFDSELNRGSTFYLKIPSITIGEDGSVETMQESPTEEA